MAGGGVGGQHTECHGPISVIDNGGRGHRPEHTTGNTAPVCAAEARGAPPHFYCMSHAYTCVRSVPTRSAASRPARARATVTLEKGQMWEKGQTRQRVHGGFSRELSSKGALSVLLIRWCPCARECGLTPP